MTLPTHVSVIDGIVPDDVLLGRGGRRTSPPHLAHRHFMLCFFTLALVVAVRVFDLDLDAEMP